MNRRQFLLFKFPKSFENFRTVAVRELWQLLKYLRFAHSETLVSQFPGSKRSIAKTTGFGGGYWRMGGRRQLLQTGQK